MLGPAASAPAAEALQATSREAPGTCDRLVEGVNDRLEAEGSCITPNRTRVRWTDDEVLALREGVMRYGEGNWAAIWRDPSLRLRFDESRDNLALKDKWRNMNAMPIR